MDGSLDFDILLTVGFDNFEVSSRYLVGWSLEMLTKDFRAFFVFLDIEGPRCSATASRLAG